MMLIQSNKTQKNKKETIENLCTNLPKWVILREIYFALLIWPILPLILIYPFDSILNVLSVIFSPVCFILYNLFMLYYIFGGICSVLFFKHRIKTISKKSKMGNDTNKKIFYLWPLLPAIGFSLSFFLSFAINIQFKIGSWPYHINMMYFIELIFAYFTMFGWLPLIYLFLTKHNCKCYQKILSWCLFFLLVPISLLSWADRVPSEWDFTPVIWSLVGIVIAVFCLKKMLMKSFLLSIIFILLLSAYGFIGYSVHGRLSCFVEHGKYVYNCPVWTTNCRYVCQK